VVDELNGLLEEFTPIASATEEAVIVPASDCERSAHPRRS
jgi:hypothetical protein